MIVVDGIKRDDCAREAIKNVSENGVIILDNSERSPEICNMFRDNGYLQVDFHSIGPINVYTWTTSIFFSSVVNLPAKDLQPQVPPGGGF